MKIKNLAKRALAWILVCITVAGSTPAVDVHAEDTSNSKVDIYATQSSDYLITIPKQLILDGKTGTGAYRVSVKGNISGTDIITVTPDERFFMKQEGKTDILTTIEQIKTQFTYADGVRPEVEVTADGKVQMEKISAGKWTGLFNFNITSSVDLESEDSVGSTIDDIKGNGTGKDTAQDKNSEYSVIDTFGSVSTDIKVSAKNEDGEDINATASTIVGTEAKELLDGLKETGYIEDTEEVDALIEVESDDFDGLAETTFDVSSIAKPGDEVIILHFDEEKQMWEFIGQETVTEEGTVTEDFTSYSPVAFVKVEKGEIKPHFHNFVTESMLDATCTSEGFVTYVCDECDHKTDVTLDPLGHNPISSITPPSCTEGGYTTYVCSRCGEEYQDDSVDATGHSYGEWETVKQPTCTEVGSKQKTCSACNDIVTEDIAALGHDYKTSSTASSCTEEGYTTYTCNTCGHSYTDDKVPALGHSYGNWVTVKEATCTETGSKQKTCSACNNVVTEDIAALGHDYKTSSTASSCTEEGYTTYTCNTCGDSYTDNTVPALGHTEVNAGTKEVHTKCSVCGVTLSTNHTYTESIVTNATCVTNGTKKYTCNCGYSYTDGIGATGHTYGDYVTTTAATCTVDGVKTKTCTVCGNKETAVITKLGHNYSTSYTVDKEATCITAGSKSQHCSRCISTQNVTSIPVIGHSYGEYVTTTAATCTVDGVKTKTCTVCGNKENAVITKLGHNYSTSYTVDKEATCTTAGSKSQHCSRCTSTQNVTSIPALGHSYGTPTYTWTGYTACKASRTCTRCNNIETENGTITNAVTTTATCTATGVRTYTAKFSNTAFATQTKTESIAKNSSNHTGSVVNGGTSTVHSKYSCCGATVSATHSYTNKVTTAATCTTAGVRTYTCGCGYSYTSAIAAPGHKYSSYSTSTTQHWKACTNGCGAKTSVANHADGGTDGLCDTCGYKGTIVYTYHTHNSSCNYTWSTTQSCAVCSGNGKISCSKCKGAGGFPIPECGNTNIVVIETQSGSISCNICGGGGWTSKVAQCTKCYTKYVEASGGHCAGSSYSGPIPTVCTSTTRDCLDCENGQITCHFCNGSNSNLVSKTCSTCLGTLEVPIDYCGGNLKLTETYSGNMSGWAKYNCEKCNTEYSEGGGYGMSSWDDVPNDLICTATSIPCSSCIDGKLYRVNVGCGKTTSTIASQYTKFE